MQIHKTRKLTIDTLKYLQEFSGVLHSLEEALAEVQRTDTKVQSTLDIKKQNLQSEEEKRKGLVKCMEEVSKLYTLVFSFPLHSHVHPQSVYSRTFW